MLPLLLALTLTCGFHATSSNPNDVEVPCPTIGDKAVEPSTREAIKTISFSVKDAVYSKVFFDHGVEEHLLFSDSGLRMLSTGVGAAN